MRYVRAQDILPQDLLDQLQQYIDGAYLYIPRKGENRLSWGDRTHSKQDLYRSRGTVSALPFFCTVLELAAPLRQLVY